MSSSPRSPTMRSAPRRRSEGHWVFLRAADEQSRPRRPSRTLLPEPALDSGLAAPSIDPALILTPLAIWMSFVPFAAVDLDLGHAVRTSAGAPCPLNLSLTSRHLAPGSPGSGRRTVPRSPTDRPSSNRGRSHVDLRRGRRHAVAASSSPRPPSTKVRTSVLLLIAV